MILERILEMTQTNVTIIQYVNPFRRLDTHPPCWGSVLHVFLKTKAAYSSDLPILRKPRSYCIRMILRLSSGF